MSAGARWTRRAALWVLASIGIGMLVRRAWPWPPDTAVRTDGNIGGPPETDRAHEWKRAGRVGAAYLRLHPDEADEARLRSVLGLAGTSTPDDLAASQLHELAARHRDDFLAGRVVRIESWLLSVTESRLAAWIHLQASHTG